MQIAGGDWRFFYPENIVDFAQLPSAWDSSLNTGIGISSLPTMWITSYLNFTAFFSHLGLSWNLITLLFWIIPPIILGTIGSFLLFRLFWKNNNNALAFLSSLIYVTNTYILMVFSGGQMGVVFAYSLLPLVLLRFIKLVKKPSLRTSVFFGFAFSLLVLFDPRITFITLIPLGLYAVMKVKIVLKYAFYIIIMPLIITLLFHCYWLVPLLIFRAPQSGFEFPTSDVSFFSFAFLENSLSLLHPNWPDNIFGKVSFMRPEFLILPLVLILGFISSKSWSKKISLAFILLLCSAFLAKGTNEPFGFMYEFLYKNVPGFSVFRDSTKFYILIALMYSLLLPISLENIGTKVSKLKVLNPARTRKIVLGGFVVFWLILALPLLTFQINGIFKLRELPLAYTDLKNFIHKDNYFYRTLWVPQWQRFGYFSNLHPAIGRGEVVKNNDPVKMAKELNTLEFKDRLEQLNVKYVIVPFDSESELFADRGKFNRDQYVNTVSALKKIPWVQEKKSFGDMKIFAIENISGRFFSYNKFLQINHFKHNNNYYKLTVINAKQNDVIFFSENYNPYWRMNINGKEVYSKRSENNLNSFTLPKGGTIKATLEFVPQRHVLVGLAASVLTFITLTIYLFIWPLITKVRKVLKY